MTEITPERLAALRRFRPPLIDAAEPVHETPQVSFGDLVRLLAEGIADAQLSLDRASAAMVEELASTTVSFIPSVTETVAADGTVTFEHAPTREISLLELGVTPTFYAFREATVEVAMDIKVVEQDTETSAGKKRFGLFAGTADIRTERKLNRDVSVHSKLTATLIPVPSPLRINPTRTTTPPA